MEESSGTQFELPTDPLNSRREVRREVLVRDREEPVAPLGAGEGETGHDILGWDVVRNPIV